MSCVPFKCVNFKGPQLMFKWDQPLNLVICLASVVRNQRRRYTRALASAHCMAGQPSSIFIILMFKWDQPLNLVICLASVVRNQQGSLPVHSAWLVSPLQYLVYELKKTMNLRHEYVLWKYFQKYLAVIKFVLALSISLSKFYEILSPSRLPWVSAGVWPESKQVRSNSCGLRWTSYGLLRLFHF